MRSIVFALSALGWVASAASSWIGGDPASEYCLYFILAYQALMTALILETAEGGRG